MKARGHFNEVRDVDPLVALDDGVRAEIDHWVAKFPPDRKRSALIQGLMAAQHANGGWLDDVRITAVARYLGQPAIYAYEVASFYSMFETSACGRHHISVCTNISCMLRGGEEMLSHLEKRLGVKVGESTPDGRFYLKQEEECLAACDGAPMMMVNHVYFEHLTPEKVDQILADHK